MADISVDLIDHMGSDLTVVNAARVSMDKESSWIGWVPCVSSDTFEDGRRFVRDLKDGDKCLVRYLAVHGHWTPFSHPQITLRETVPIFLARQRFRHTVGFTYNEVSRRYVDDEPSFYKPRELRQRPEDSIKQGSGGVHPSSSLLLNGYEGWCETALEQYKYWIAIGVAPEQARMVLPQSMMTSYYVTGSLAAFARAYRLRADPHAQREIQDLAAEWDRIIRPLYPVSWGALVDA